MKETLDVIARYYTYTSLLSFERRVMGALIQIPIVKTVVSITVFSESTNESYHRELAQIRKMISEYLGYMPLVTYVVQPGEVAGAISMEVYNITTTLPETIELECGVRYMSLVRGSRQLLLVEGIASSSFFATMREQSDEVFSKIQLLLTHVGHTPKSIVRQWNYIGNITAVGDDGVQHYQAFNDARSEFYSTDSWDYGYPAATGIGASCDGLVVSLLLLDDELLHDVVPIDNPLQIAAHAYGKQVLIGDDSAPKTTPKFERAKSFVVGNMSFCYISGTAAIRGEESLHGADAVSQTMQTIENIEYLISDENMARYNSQASSLEPYSLRVYVKNLEDLYSVKQVVNARWTKVPTIYLQADVCRGELLVEIEGAAKGGVR